MENNTNFDLNNALAQWRQCAAGAPALTAENLRELEAHLKDSIVKLQSCGLSLAESVQIATQRLGSIETLGPEFAKINMQRVWLDRALWMAAGLQVYLFASSIARLAAATLIALGQGLWFKMISREMEKVYSVQDRALDSVIYPVVYWIVLVTVIWRLWRSISQGGLDIAYWTKVAKRHLWRLGGGLTLIGLLLSLSGYLAQELLHKLFVPHTSMGYFSLVFSWQYYLTAIPYVASVPLGLVWILRKQQMSETAEKVGP